MPTFPSKPRTFPSCSNFRWKHPICNIAVSQVALNSFFCAKMIRPRLVLLPITVFSELLFPLAGRFSSGSARAGGGGAWRVFYRIVVPAQGLLFVGSRYKCKRRENHRHS